MKSRWGWPFRRHADTLGYALRHPTLYCEQCDDIRRHSYQRQVFVARTGHWFRFDTCDACGEGRQNGATTVPQPVEGNGVMGGER